MTDPRRPAEATESAFKSRGGLQRIARAAGYSLAGLRAAVRHEHAFRQELFLAVPMLALVGSVLLVLVAELLNSAVEAVCDAVTVERHPLIGRAKDIGSAAVMLCLIFTVLVWAVVLWP